MFARRSIVIIGMFGLCLSLLLCRDGLAQATKDKASPPPPPRIGMASVKPRTEGTIRLASYNVENLFDDKDDPALSGDVEDLDDTKPAAHCQAVAQTLRKIDADVVALQEIESLEALLWFRDSYLKDMGYEHVVSLDAGDERGIENAVISRFPLRDVKVWVHEPLEGEHPEKLGGRENEWAGKPLVFHRSPLRVTVDVPGEKTGSEKGYALHLFVVHHKSGRPFTYWREAEAKKTIEFIQAFENENEGANIALLGDFNAEVMDDSVRMYLDAGLKDLFFDRPLDDARMLTHASERAIDMILYNAALSGELVMKSRFVLATPQLPSEADWRTAPKPEGYASDHLPVVVDLKPVD